MHILTSASKLCTLLAAVALWALSWSPGLARAQTPAADSGDVAAQRRELRISLAEAMRIAFQNNLDIRVVGFDRSLAQERVTSAKGRFEPFFFIGIPGATGINPFPGGAAFGGGGGFGGFGFSDIQSPASTALAGADTVTSQTGATLFDFQQTLQGGMRYDVTYNVSRTDTNSIFQSLNPSWDNTLAVSIVQPLLNGRGRDAAAVDMLLAQANTVVSEHAFRSQVEAILLQVERAYWQLVFAERDLAVKESSLQLAREQLGRTEVQVEVGLIAPVQTTQAEVQVAARETELIVARNGLEDARDVLRVLLRAEALPNGWDTALEPTDEPRIEAAPVNLQAAIAAAMEKRPEIDQGQAVIEARGVEVRANQSALLPRVDLLAQVSVNGIGGDRQVRQGAFPGQIVDVIPGGYGDAIDQLFSFDFTSWRLGVNVTVPIGNSTAKGNYAQATINQDRARVVLERTKQRVILEVRQAARGVTAAAEAARSAAKTRQLAERQLEIETDRFEVGMSTNFEVLRFQDDLAVVRSGELRAVIEHRLAVAELERATGRLLDKYGIRIRSASERPS